MSYLDDYPAGTVEGDLVRDPVRMLREIRKLEDETADYGLRVQLLEDMMRRFERALEAPDNPTLARQAKSAAKEYQARQLWIEGMSLAQIGKRIDRSRDQVRRYVDGIPKGASKA